MNISNINSTHFQQQMFSLTTPILATFKLDNKPVSSQASGFYYTEVTPSNDPEWNKLNKFWLITNKHVVIYKKDNREYLAEHLEFYIRIEDNHNIEWEKFSLNKSELSSVLKLHNKEETDVVVIDISEKIKNFYTNNHKTTNVYKYFPVALTNENLPNNQPMEIGVTSDIVVASYPKGFYDTKNKFPIIKSGIISSAWGYKFNNLPIFQIDAQLFPGSSGGLVISKPTNIAMINGSLHFNESKQFIFLGVYSGEYMHTEELNFEDKKIPIKKSYGLGTVWYSYLIEEIIQNGINFTNYKN